jgi:NAD+ diphosphatase
MRPVREFAGPPLFVCVHEAKILVRRHGDLAELPGEPCAGNRHILGSLGDRPCLAIDAADGRIPPGLEWLGLRALYGLVSDQLWGIAARAAQVIEWDRTHRFCGRCGSATVPSEHERVRHCPNCELDAYPRVSPAIIVLVTRGEDEGEALLAWGSRRRDPHYSTLAGFVEPGETLEEAVAREVREETGIEVTGLRYFGSQAWPFPHQLMVGYRAQYAGGELRLQDSEIRDARWFTPSAVDSITASRGGFSIAGRLIDGWIGEQAVRKRTTS